MSTYTVTLRAAQGGRIPHTFRGIEAEDAYAAIRDAYYQRHGADIPIRRSNIHTRNVDAGEYVIYGGNNSVTFVDVETVEPVAAAATAPVQGTVRVKDVWRCGRYSTRSGLAKRDAYGYIEVPQLDVDHARTMGTSLFRIVE